MANERRFAMAAPVQLRDDFGAAALRGLAKASRDPGQLRRLLSLAAKAPGQVPKLNDAQRRALVQVVETGPDPAIHGVVRWRLVDLVQWVWEEFRIEISVQTLSRELRALGYRKLSARPRHYAQDKDAMAAFKKTSPPSWRRSRPRRPRART
jgi:transposase